MGIAHLWCRACPDSGYHLGMDLATRLLLPAEVDLLLRYPPGRSERLARRGKLPHVALPDGVIRFNADVIGTLLERARRCGADVNGENGK